MGYVQALALLGPKTQSYVTAKVASTGIEAPNAIIAAIVDGANKATIDAMTAADLAARMPGFDVTTPVALENLLAHSTVPATATAFEAALP